MVLCVWLLRVWVWLAIVTVCVWLLTATLAEPVAVAVDNEIECVCEAGAL